ncbi:hypothetical protein MMC08_007821 [Hypocenomyce scalaris]|nr:hypothetical protein [Hypocenomyce scalaris]
MRPANTRTVHTLRQQLTAHITTPQLLNDFLATVDASKLSADTPLNLRKRPRDHLHPSSRLPHSHHHLRGFDPVNGITTAIDIGTTGMVELIDEAGDDLVYGAEAHKTEPQPPGPKRKGHRRLESSCRCGRNPPPTGEKDVRAADDGCWDGAV